MMMFMQAIAQSISSCVYVIDLMMMMFIVTDQLLYSLETKARRVDGEYARLYEGAEGRNSRGTHGHSLH